MDFSGVPVYVYGVSVAGKTAVFTAVLLALPFAAFYDTGQSGIKNRYRAEDTDDISCCGSSLIK